MGKSVTVLSNFTNFRGPSTKGYRSYNAGATIVYTDAEYTALSAADLRALSSPTTVPDPVRPSVDASSRAVNVVAAATGSQNLALGPNALTLSGNITLVFPTGVASGNESSVELFATQGTGGSKTITWGSKAKFAGATAPTISTVAGKLDWFRFVTIDGGNTWIMTDVVIDAR